MYKSILKKDIVVKRCIQVYCTYHSVNVDQILKWHNHSFKNSGHKTIILDHFIKLLKVIPSWLYFFYKLNIWLLQQYKRNNTSFNQIRPQLAEILMLKACKSIIGFLFYLCFYRLKRQNLSKLKSSLTK